MLVGVELDAGLVSLRRLSNDTATLEDMVDLVLVGVDRKSSDVDGRGRLWRWRRLLGLLLLDLAVGLSSG